jgi:hypothetical protein
MMRRLVFIMKMQCVICEVVSEVLDVLEMDLSSHTITVLIGSLQYVKTQEDELVGTQNEITVAYFKALVLD